MNANTRSGQVGVGLELGVADGVIDGVVLSVGLGRGAPAADPQAESTMTSRRSAPIRQGRCINEITAKPPLRYQRVRIGPAPDPTGSRRHSGRNLAEAIHATSVTGLFL